MILLLVIISLTDKDGKDYSDIKLIVDIVEYKINIKWQKHVRLMNFKDKGRSTYWAAPHKAT